MTHRSVLNMDGVSRPLKQAKMRLQDAVTFDEIGQHHDQLLRMKSSRAAAPEELYRTFLDRLEASERESAALADAVSLLGSAVKALSGAIDVDRHFAEVKAAAASTAVAATDDLAERVRRLQRAPGGMPTDAWVGGLMPCAEPSCDTAVDLGASGGRTHCSAHASSAPRRSYIDAHTMTAVDLDQLLVNAADEVKKRRKELEEAERDHREAEERIAAYDASHRSDDGDN